MAAHDSVEQLIDQLSAIRSDMLELEGQSTGLLGGLSSTSRESARNLFHYLALRRHDIRNLQDQLASLGLSSLGRAEPCVFASLDAVLKILHHLRARKWELPAPAVLEYARGKALLQQHTQVLLGPAPDRRSVRIMVTMPSEAAEDHQLVRDLLAGGMDCMRINCAHDDPARWSRMIAHLRRAEKELGKKCRILMDLPGPKLRTGPMQPGPRVVKCRPRRDCLGRVTARARIWLFPCEQPLPPPSPADAAIPVPGDWLSTLTVGERVRFRDARGASRSMTIVEEAGASRWAESSKTVYFATDLVLQARSRRHRDKPSVKARKASVGELAASTVSIVLKSGDVLVLTRELRPGNPASFDDQGRLTSLATIGCSLPEVFLDLRPGENVWLDDGKIGGVVKQASPDAVHVEITHSRPGGDKLGADKGINLPDTTLRLPPLTSQDLEALDFIAAHSDLVGLSFVRHAQDVGELQSRLAERGGQHLGIILKIETRRAFDELPLILVAALRSPSVGVMIARGDLAVECGYERLAELQEEILWICEAAHLPVIWATQVLENLAKKGMPSRAEITDAAMGERAECVMLNKGPHIREALRVLDDILRRMQGHQSKKRSMLRQLQLAEHFPGKQEDSSPHAGIAHSQTATAG
jgi:pyruvate kinase